MNKGIGFKWDYEGEVTNMSLVSMKDFYLVCATGKKLLFRQLATKAQLKSGNLFGSCDLMVYVSPF